MFARTLLASENSVGRVDDASLPPPAILPLCIVRMPPSAWAAGVVVDTAPPCGLSPCLVTEKTLTGTFFPCHPAFVSCLTCAGWRRAALTSLIQLRPDINELLTYRCSKLSVA